MRKLIPYLLALLGGLLLPLAFAPFGWSWLAPVCLFLLFASWLNATPLQALARGYLFGMAQFGVGISWVYNSMHDYGGASALEAGGLTALFVLILSCYPGLAGWLAVRLFGGSGKHIKLLVAFPAFWVILNGLGVGSSPIFLGCKSAPAKWTRHWAKDLRPCLVYTA